MTGTAAIAALPKAELHLHLVGSASVQTVLTLATRTPGAGVPLDPAELAAFYTFRDFAHFIDVYNAVDRLVTTPADVTTLVVGAARDAAVSNVRWLELTVTAATHLKAGIDGGALRAALEEGRERARSEHGVEIGWIVDIPGEQGLGAANATVDFLTRHAPAGTVAIGLAGLEPDAPRRDFVRHVAQARDLGLRAAIHAGEASGPESVHDALSLLHADRIGHGLRAADDPSLVAFLADAGTPLEVCVTSNVCTGVVTGPDAHPVAALAAAGVVVVPGTDDPGMFGTDLNAEYALVARLTGRDPADLARAAVAASFAPDTVKAALLAELGA